MGQSTGAGASRCEEEEEKEEEAAEEEEKEKEEKTEKEEGAGKEEPMRFIGTGRGRGRRRGSARSGAATKKKAGPPTLRLLLRRSPFDVMATGEKKVKYREPSKYIVSRLYHRVTNAEKRYEIIEFTNGYNKMDPQFICR